MRFFNFIITLVLLSTASNINAQAQQQDSVILEKIIGQSKKLSDQHPSEKVYLHFDKPYYSVGDTIWFKAYLTMETNMPSLLSKIVYVDVINSRDSLVRSIKIPVVNGVASGNIPIIPLVYQQGNYYIKGYTLWMMNDAEDYFFNKTIPIGEAVNKQLITQFSYKTVQTDKNQTIDALVQFKNKDGVVQAGKAVTWKVLSNFDVITKGKGTTDQNGFLKVKIDAKKNEPITNGELLTELTLGPDDVAPSSFRITPSKSSNDFQFFPEGGELVSGIATRIGFKALNSAGLGADLKGTITDSQGNSITTFASSHLGMGSFFLNAEVGKTYKANITFKDGTVKSYDLPKAIPAGVAIQVANTAATELSVKIVANETYFNANKDKRMFLVVTNN
ncbi:MAG: carboxypeptidase regulatory-like domain-containing protein, partial [Pedobacter sp.]